MTGDEIYTDQNTIYPYSDGNLWYEPIPYEWLKSYVEEPQVLVSVNGTPAVCHNLNCGFNFIEPVGQVETFSYDPDTLLVNVTGVELPQTIEEIRYIEFAKTKCDLDTATFESWYTFKMKESTKIATRSVEIVDPDTYVSTDSNIA
jgi:hypothetical protein